MADKEARKKTDFSSAVRYTPDPLTGLDGEQVKERVANGFANYDATVGTKSVSRIIIGHLMTLFNLVNIIIAIALVAAFHLSALGVMHINDTDAYSVFKLYQSLHHPL